MRIADPIPPGDTSFRAIVLAIVPADLVNVPSGGKVDSVLILADHFLFWAIRRYSLYEKFMPYRRMPNSKTMY